MNMEMPNSEGKKVIKMTTAEYAILNSGASEARKALMEKFGIDYNPGGEIDIEIDGQERVMVTDEDDFGTLAMSEQEIKAAIERQTGVR